MSPTFTNQQCGDVLFGCVRQILHARGQAVDIALHVTRQIVDNYERQGRLNYLYAKLGDMNWIEKWVTHLLPSLTGGMILQAVQPTLLIDVGNDVLGAIATELAESDLASAVALKRCSSRFKELATKPVADAVERINEQWRVVADSIGGPSAAEIKGELERNGVLTNLNLWGNGIGDEGAKAIGEALAVNGVLTSLNVSVNKIGPTGATAIAEALRVNGVLTELWLGGNGIGDKSAAGNEIGDEGAAALASALRVNGVLKTLAIGNNSIGVEGAKAIAEALQGNAVLKSINLRGNSLDTEGWCAIFAALRDNKENKIESWDLSGERINTEVTEVLAEYVSVSGVLTKLDLDGHKLDLPKLRGTHPVTSLDLSGEGLGPASAIMIASLIADNAVLKTLNLANNSIRAEGAAAIAEALRGNGVLKALTLHSNYIGDEGAKAIGGALAVNEVRLTTLDLSNNQIDDKGTVAIADALRVNEVLTKLDLSRNGIDDAGAEALASALRVNEGLTTLDLRANYSLGDEGKGAIRDAVSGRAGKGAWV